jgi:hypothetical protein
MSFMKPLIEEEWEEDKVDSMKKNHLYDYYD